jgi:predicted nucleic acid-binding protein
MAAQRRLVVNSSVVLKWVLAEPGRNYAIELLNEYESGLTDLIAPALLMEEAASARSKRCRRKELTAAQASKAYQFLEPLGGGGTVALAHCPGALRAPSLEFLGLRLSRARNQ